MGVYSGIPLGNKKIRIKSPLLTPAQVRELVTERNEGTSIVQLAEKFNTSVSTITNALYGRGAYTRD